jgi:hypothetical protein
MERTKLARDARVQGRVNRLRRPAWLARYRLGRTQLERLFEIARCSTRHNLDRWVIRSIGIAYDSVDGSIVRRLLFASHPHLRYVPSLMILDTIITTFSCVRHENIGNWCRDFRPIAPSSSASSPSRSGRFVLGPFRRLPCSTELSTALDRVVGSRHVAPGAARGFNRPRARPRYTGRRCRTYFSRRGVFQYGDLHLGQIIGSRVLSRGSHSCSQRSQR